MPSVSRSRPFKPMTYDGGIMERSTESTSTRCAEPSESRYLCGLVAPRLESAVGFPIVLAQAA